MNRRSSLLLRRRMWSILRTIRTRTLPKARILMARMMIPHKVGMLVVPSKEQAALELVVPNKVLVRLNKVQVQLSKAQVVQVQVQVQVVPSKVQAALVQVVPSKVLVAQVQVVLSKVQAALELAVLSKVQVVLVQVVLNKAQAVLELAVPNKVPVVLELAERLAKRMNISLIKRRSSRNMTGERLTGSRRTLS